ncbi:phage virion morphogenesis protein [Rhodobacter lacus]|uniref:Phage virion morphogenesis protein n=1 Tax=Rhodobacter lacus TaxID=1641972 RepID=A0ABW5AA78_9RHOB
MFAVEVNDKQITATLDGIEGKLANQADLMAQIAELLLDSTVERFQTGTAPDGTPWAPKSSTTIAAYEARKEPVSFKPLIGPTKSLSAITNFATASGEDWARISSRAIQSAVMQFGAEKGAFGAFMGLDKRGRRHFHSILWGDIPARPFLGISSADEEAVIAAIEEWL